MKTQQNLCEGPLFSGIVRYSVPIILTGILQLLFNAADLVIVGRFCGSLSVGAVGATGPMVSLIVNLFIGLSVGAGVNTAHAIGAKNHAEVSRLVHTALPLAFISGLVMSIIGVCCSGRLLLWMDTPEDVLSLSTVYMQLYFCGMVPCMVYNFGAAILRAAGDTQGPLLYLTLAGVVNVILNIVFVTALHMDVAGVALATTLSQCLSAALVVRALCRREDACKLDRKKIGFDKAALVKIVSVGVPAGIQNSLFAISNILIQSGINSFGAEVISGNAAAGNIEGFVYVVMNAFHQTALNYCGQNVGAAQYRRVRQIVRVCLLCVTIVGMVCGGGVFLLRNPLLRIYITDSDAAIADGALRMAFTCVPYFVLGIMDVLNGALRGMGFSAIPTVVSIFGICVMRVVWVKTVFQAIGTPESLYISYVISWAATFLVLYVAFVFLYRRLIQRSKKD